LILATGLLVYACSAGIKELRKGETFYKIDITDDVSLEFVRDYSWELSAGVDAIIHRYQKPPIRTATIDYFSPSQEPAPKYGFIKTNGGIIGVYNQENPKEIVMLLDMNDFTHLPDRSAYPEITTSDKMVESFEKEFPDYVHYLKKGR